MVGQCTFGYTPGKYQQASEMTEADERQSSRECKTMVRKPGNRGT